MGIKFRPLSGFLVLLATAIAFPAVATAETAAPNYESTNDVFERAYFRHDRNFYENLTPKRQLDAFLGSGSGFRNSFPENEIARDAELVNTLYRDVLTQQSMNDPYLRTPDLPNPYGTSLLMSPQMNANKLRMGTEFRFETALPR
ncbi:conserved hypothetical protein [Trichormus variabilis ATCC 29413]|uniref:Uncharacterized protein n=2 Tax=Anabaena variabilis TaxID=264691 RepID=Q3MAK9_TRIV2|nr:MULTISPECIES: hypothetical protein [Nostocaceae]ABA21977.1 conserved hypothetical protein [Trichormus variabilis ATCC 29413]MBC1216989.1 hypothetical protein [Trichormus variabilis ARAD]MBC1256443.1 hypothetical protein [Trichormus variabilis V5]MBC1269635.1 hypothetical protein [Trichormus variabilis FSR]MBC1305143.1 hypothetical protein [Trichormus variabilis N2B]